MSVRRPGVGNVQGQIRGNHADQVDKGEIMTFGNHLGSHEDIDFPFLQLPEDLFAISPSGDRVPVHPPDGGLGEMPPDLGLQAFRSGSVTEYAPSSAGGAGFSHFFAVIAVMTVQTIRIAVEGQGTCNGGNENPFRQSGSRKGVKPPPVEKQQGW